MLTLALVLFSRPVLIASSLAEKKKLEDHETMLLKYGMVLLSSIFRSLESLSSPPVLLGDKLCLHRAN